MTAPPYEWPTSTIGPEIVRRKSATSAVSLVRPRRGLSTARTAYPSRCRRSTSPLQLAALAQAPWTKTIVGFTAHPAAGMGVASTTDEFDKAPPKDRAA